MNGAIPVSLKGGRLKGEVNADYYDDPFLDFLNALPDAVAAGRYPLLKQREDRLYLAVEIDRRGDREPLFIKVDDFTRRIRIKKWIRNLLTPSRAEKSWRAGEAFLRLGISTPTPVAFLETRRWGFLLRSYLLVRRIPAAEAIHQRYARCYREGASAEQAQEKARLISALARDLSAMHENGVVYGDLKASNVLVASEGERLRLSFVDLESVRLFDGVPISARIEDLGSLFGSFLGLLSRRDVLFFIRAYRARSPRLKGETKGLVRAIYRYAVGRKKGAPKPPCEGSGSG